MLINLLKTFCADDMAAGDWESCADTLNASDVVVSDPTPVTYSLIRERLGEEARKAVADTLRAVAAQDGDIADAHQLLLTGGLRLDLPERQTALQQLAVAGNWSPELLSGVAALGRRLTSVMANNGLAAVTPAQCEIAARTDALQEFLNSRRLDFDAKYNTVIYLIQNGNITTTNQITAALIPD